MRETKVYCDMCGKEMYKDTGVYPGTHYRMRQEEVYLEGAARSHMEMDLCRTCGGKVQAYIDSETKAKK